MPAHSDLLLESRPDAEGDALEIEGLPGCFVVHFQPEFDLASREITGCEALLRWSHPEYGLLRPGAALHHSKWSDALADAEDWATSAVIRQAAMWRTAGTELQVALNVSPRQLDDPALAASIEAEVERSGADRTQLRLDVPVGAFTTQRLAVLPTVETLAELGILIVADGVTGAPSAPLDGLPIHFVKANVHVGRRTNLANLHPMVHASVALARELGAVSIAKAVRSRGELDVLARAGFDRAFGDMLSPAISADELLALLP